MMLDRRDSSDLCKIYKTAPAFEFSCDGMQIWIRIVVIALLLLPIFVFVRAVKNYGLQFKLICASIKQTIATQVETSICRYYDNSSCTNSLLYYFVVLLSIFNGPLLALSVIHLEYQESKTPKSIVLDSRNVMFGITATLMKGALIFSRFVIFEVINIRAIYFKKTSKNFYSSTVSGYERQELTKFLLKKSFIFGFIFSVAYLFCTLYFLHDFNRLDVNQTGYSTYGLLLHGFLLASILPLLRILRYEKMLANFTIHISRQAHLEGLALRHLQEIGYQRCEIPAFVKNLGCCEQCQQLDNPPKICEHSVSNTLDERIKFLTIKLEKQRVVASMSQAVMMPCSHRNPIGWIRVILIWMLISNFIQIAYYLNNLVIIISLIDNEELNKGFFVWMSTLVTMTEWILLPLFTLIILNEEQTFGVFHRVFDVEELEDDGESFSRTTSDAYELFTDNYRAVNFTRKITSNFSPLVRSGYSNNT